MAKKLLNYLIAAIFITLIWPAGLAGPAQAAVLAGKKPSKPPTPELALMMMDYPQYQV